MQTGLSRFVKQSLFWYVFRFVFVAFSLYLMGDAFYRWDGYRYLASFPVFLLNLALTFVLWSFIAFLASILLWFSCVIFKRIVLERFSSGRNWFPEFLKKLQYHITPLFWMFACILLVAVPVVVFNVFIRGGDGEVSQSQGLVEYPDDGGDRPNIILITYDALTARDMSLYGYERDTTSFIDEWSKDASVFTRVQASSNFTGPTCASLLTGKRVWTHLKYDPHSFGRKPVNSEVENLALELRNSGYYTMAFVQNVVASPEALGISNSFMINPDPFKFYKARTLLTFTSMWLKKKFKKQFKFYYWILEEDFILRKLINKLTEKGVITEFPAEVVYDYFFSIADRKLKEPFFAWIHLLPPHDPYLPPPPYMGGYDSSSMLRTDKKIHSVIHKAMRNPDIDQKTAFALRARYDEFIKYSDDTFRHFIGELSTKNIENTILILSSDHGESFEHGYFTHGGAHLYEQVTHIPLIIKEPGQSRGQRLSALVGQIDIPATILDFADVPVPEWMEGQSLVPLLHGNEIESRPVFSMYLAENPSHGQGISKGTFAVWEGDYKLIHYLEKEESLLFNLKDDPGELINLFNKEVHRGQHLLEVLKERIEFKNGKYKNHTE